MSVHSVCSCCLPMPSIADQPPLTAEVTTSPDSLGRERNSAKMGALDASSNSPMAFQINKVAVLGAGTMGSRIAAHLANAGIPSYLLDIVPPAAPAPDKAGERTPERDKIVLAGLDAAKKSKPAAFFDPSLARLIKTGNFEDDLKLLADADLIIEVVAENLQIKRDLLRKVEAVRKPTAIVTTNTSGLPVASI